MTGFRSFAQAATNGTKTMVLSHSQVFTGGPSGYCNTVQTADDILATIGLTATPSSDVGLGSLQRYRYAHSGNFTLYGATGGDETAHLKHLNFSAQFFDDLPLATVPEPSAAMTFLFGAPLALWLRR